MKGIRLIKHAVILVVVAFCGCIGPRPLTMRTIDMPFLVVDEASGAPLIGALIRVVYEGPNGEHKERGPFVADESGRGRIVVKKEVLWLSATDLYFAGGYSRSIRVHVDGYKDGGYYEALNSNALDTQHSMTFKLERLPTRSGE
jgi:hypothetical protein